jgi:hypothetical protein
VEPVGPGQRWGEPVGVVMAVAQSWGASNPGPAPKGFGGARPFGGGADRRLLGGLDRWWADCMARLLAASKRGFKGGGGARHKVVRICQAVVEGVGNRVVGADGFGGIEV